MRRAQRLCKCREYHLRHGETCQPNCASSFPTPCSYNICFPSSFLPNLLALFAAFFPSLPPLVLLPPAVVMFVSSTAFYISDYGENVPVVQPTHQPPRLSLHGFGSAYMLNEIMSICNGSICLSNLGISLHKAKF